MSVIFIHKLGIKTQMLMPMPMCCNNQVTIFIIENLIFYECIEHIEIKCHITHDKGYFKTPFVFFGLSH